jgi:hypothetical protein
MGKLKESVMWPNAPDMSKGINQHLADNYFDNHPDRIYSPPVNKYRIIKTAEGDRVEEVKTIVVHSFRMSDVEDPDLWAAESLIEWEKSDQGQWVMRNACDTPTWHRQADAAMYGYKYIITAKLTGPALTEWLLRYGR